MKTSLIQKRFSPKHHRIQPIKNGFNWVAVTSLVSVSVPILYVIGRVYDEYYLGAYGVSAELFPKSTQDYLFFAMIGLFEAIYSLFDSFKDNWIKIGLGALGASMYIGFLLWFGNVELRPWMRHTARSIVTTRTARIFGVLSSGPILVAMGWILLSFVLVVLLLPILIGYSAGKRVALVEIKQDSGACAAKVRKDLKACVVVTKNGQKLIAGRLIAASDSLVAIASEGKAIIFSRENIKIEVQH